MKAAPLAVLCAAQLMVLLDGTIVNIALPAVAGDLGLSPGAAQWPVTGYYLAFGGLLLLGGRAGDLFGRRAVFLAGIAVFTAASLAGGFATTAAALIAARVVQGLGAAAAAPSILALIHTAYTEPGPRTRALAVYAAMSSVGAATGLIAGGLLTQYLSWRWVFFVNVPLGAAVLALGVRLLPAPPRRRTPLDLPGAVTVTTALTLLVYSLSRAGSDRWTSPGVLAPLAAAAGLLAVFAVIERRAAAPLLPLSLLRPGARMTGPEPAEEPVIRGHSS
ncbi:MFS transporter, partial [Dactylosporangium vinaceum]